MATERKHNFFRKTAAKTGETIWRNKSRLLVSGFFIWLGLEAVNNVHELLNKVNQPIQPAITTPDLRSTQPAFEIASSEFVTVTIKARGNTVYNTILSQAYDKENQNILYRGYVTALKNSRARVFIKSKDGHMDEIPAKEIVWKNWHIRVDDEILIEVPVNLPPQ